MEDFNNDRDCACASDKEHLKEFIEVWKTCPEIWLYSCEEYRDKHKKDKAFDKLLDIYKHIKPDSTRYDVKRKLNCLRTNFRKEWKRVKKCKLSGVNYVPSNWRYYELNFLIKDFEETDRERPEQPKRINVKDVEGLKADHDYDKDYKDDQTENEEWVDTDKYSESSMDPLVTPVKGTKMLDYQIPNTSRDSDNEEEEDYMAKVWAKKLKKLEPAQKLYAEKAINDILFEAQLQNLQYKE